MSGDLKDQLKAWKQEHDPAPQVEKKPSNPGLTPKQARRAAERAAREAEDAAARAKAEELANLSDDELFERAVSHIGDGSVAILQKYGHGHLSGEGEPVRASGKKRAEQKPAEPEDPSKLDASDTNLFLDMVGDIKPMNG